MARPLAKRTSRQVAALGACGPAARRSTSSAARLASGTIITSATCAGVGMGSNSSSAHMRVNSSKPMATNGSTTPNSQSRVCVQPRNGLLCAGVAVLAAADAAAEPCETDSTTGSLTLHLPLSRAPPRPLALLQRYGGKSPSLRNSPPCHGHARRAPQVRPGAGHPLLGPRQPLAPPLATPPTTFDSNSQQPS